jgi:hypothetical protein
MSGRRSSTVSGRTISARAFRQRGCLSGGLPDAFLDEIMGAEEVAFEILGAIEILNRPLATRQSPDSETPAGLIYDGATFDEEAEWPDGTRPYYLIQAWIPWVTECLEMTDGDGGAEALEVPGKFQSAASL